jgi:capsular polysaccharide biosynthesis protein
MLYKSNKIEAINIQESCSNIIPIFPEESFTMPKLYEYGKGNKGVCFSPYKVKVSACNLYIIPKGKILVNREEVFTQDNKVVQEITSQRINPFIDQPSTSLKNPKVIRGKVLHLSLSGLENNYYHFTVEFLARWYLWLCSGIEYDWITFPLKNSFHLDCANLLGIDLNKILPSENLNCIKADEILIPSMINNWNLVYYKSYPHALKMFLPSWLTQCHSLIRTRNNQFSSNNIQKLQDIKRIYISRKKASYRYVLNENNLSDVFVKYQISPVILEDLSLTEQIILFSDLEIVISPHGAGLVNISYSQNSTKILEIYPYNYHDSSFRIHAKVFGHHYDYLIGEKPQDESLKPSYENIYIDTNRIDKWLSENVSHDILLGHFKDLKRNMEVEESLLIIPIVFLIFNRPDTTARVFETIRQAKPPKLLIVADGPRSDRPDDIENCKAARAIVEKIDWDCEVFRNYSEVNLGCRKRVISGLDWVFEQVEEAIILEDDCLPHPTFFRYCQELLEKYRNDTRIMMISGDNFQFGRNKTEHSYYFSRYGHIWGWATWRRSWLLFDESMSTWPERRDQKWLEQLLGNEQAAVFWTRIFQGVYDGFNTWDYIWIFTLWSHNGLTILPNINLISNIGFGSGTHTTMQNSPFANMKIASMPFPLVHPNLIQQNIEADNFTELTQFSQVDLSRQENRSVQCKICGGNSYYFANAQILQKYDVSYFQCSVCKFVQTEEPYWLEEAYSKAIASSDVGLVYRNILMADITAKILYNFFDHNASFLDYGGGMDFL